MVTSSAYKKACLALHVSGMFGFCFRSILSGLHGTPSLLVHSVSEVAPPEVYLPMRIFEVLNVSCHLPLPNFISSHLPLPLHLGVEAVQLLGPGTRPNVSNNVNNNVNENDPDGNSVGDSLEFQVGDLVEYWSDTYNRWLEVRDHEGLEKIKVLEKRLKKTKNAQKTITQYRLSIKPKTWIPRIGGQGEERIRCGHGGEQENGVANNANRVDTANSVSFHAQLTVLKESDNLKKEEERAAEIVEEKVEEKVEEVVDEEVDEKVDEKFEEVVEEEVDEEVAEEEVAERKKKEAEYLRRYREEKKKDPKFVEKEVERNEEYREKKKHEKKLKVEEEGGRPENTKKTGTRETRQKWTLEEDKQLWNLIQKYRKDWTKITELMHAWTVNGNDGNDGNLKMVAHGYVLRHSVLF
jgi:hypothetical protein